MRKLVLGLVLGVVGGAAAPAQEAGTDPAPMVLTVRPSSFDPGEEARTRQERLLRRAQQRDFAFRSICTGCAALAANAPVGAVFHPFDALANRPKRPERPEPPAIAGVGEGGLPPEP